MIEIRDLYKYYGEHKAVGPLTFSIEPGEIVGLLGLNGAGKTTTLRVLACDLLPSSGSVEVDGLDVVDQPHEVRKRIGYLPDTPPLYGEMTVSEYLTFAARLRGVERDQAPERVQESLESTHLTDVADDLISSLSHGFRQRVGIAQAIVHNPRLLVLDEPISGLDPVQIVEMRGLLRGLGGKHTIILSSHILSEISETCDRILVIQDGEIGASGSEAELTAKMNPGITVAATVRGDAGRARELALDVEGVESASIQPSLEAGEDLTGLWIEADRDVREALCKAWVGGDIGIRSLARQERELESIFLRLTGQDDRAGPADESSKRARRSAR